MPTAEQQRAALSTPRRDQAHRLIIIAWLDRCRVATKSMASAEIQRSRLFGEHRSPPFAVQPEANGSGRLRSGHPSSRGQLRRDCCDPATLPIAGPEPSFRLL
jgi:hypothetical protein